MIELEFSDEELSKMYALKNIIRYNHRTRATDETVAEHSFFTSIITLTLCERLNLSTQQSYDCIVKALLHDMPETELNDITYDVKTKLCLYPMLKKYEDEFYKREFPAFEKLMTNDSASLTNLIVNLADAISVEQYCQHEISLSNIEMKKIATDATKRIDKLKNDIEEILKI